MKKTVLIFLSIIYSCGSNAQQINQDSFLINNDLKFQYQALIPSTVLIGFGVIGLESHALKDLNSDTKNELNEHIDEKVSIDDFSQYSPFLTVYALDAAGIKSKNNFKDRTIILATSYLIMGTAVNISKWTGNEVRPDKSSNNSFPSGHTATAFMGAEFLYQEYKHESIWYGISGYAVAAGTGFFRMYNNRHWLTDISAGAGIGILSTKIAYWIHPLFRKRVFKDAKKWSGVIVPIYYQGQIGLGISMVF